MTPQRRNFYKNQLLALRRRLRGDVDRMTSDAIPLRFLWIEPIGVLR